MATSTSSQPEHTTHSLRIFVGAIIVIISILKLINVFNAPVDWDTNLYLNVGTNFIDHNALTPFMWRFNPSWPPMPGAGAGGYATVLLGLWLKVFGLSVTSGHVLMYLVGLVTLPVFYLLVKSWWNEQGALWGLLFFVLSSTFFQDYYVRMDAVNILVCTSILLLHITAVKTNRKLLHFLVGIALGFALEVHILAALYIGALGLYYLVIHLAEIRKTKKIWVVTPAIFYGIGLAIALAVYAVIHILPDPTVYFLIANNVRGGIPVEILRWRVYLSAQSFLVAIMLPALGIVLVYRTWANTHYLIILIGGLITMVLLNPPASLPYTGMLLPLLAMALAALMADLRPLIADARRKGMLFQGLSILFLIATLAVRFTQTAFTFQREYGGLPYLSDSNAQAQAYIDAIQYIRANVPHDAVIMARLQFYSDLLEYHNFMSYRDGDLYGTTIRGESILSFWEREQPVIFIGDPSTDTDLLHFMDLQGGFEEVKPGLWISKSYLASVKKPNVSAFNAFG